MNQNTGCLRSNLTLADITKDLIHCLKSPHTSKFCRPNKITPPFHSDKNPGQIYPYPNQDITDSGSGIGIRNSELPTFSLSFNHRILHNTYPCTD